MGEESDRIFSNGHQNLSVYGIGKEFTKRQWQTFVHQFVSKEVLIRDLEFGSLKLTPKSYDILFGKEKVLGFIKEPRVSKRKLKLFADGEGKYDSDLFELLRKKRKELADIKNIPPYVIFSDKTLIQIATDYPQTENEFLRISGIGTNKLETYGSIFLTIIKSYCKRKNISSQASIRQQKKSGRQKTKNNSDYRYVLISEEFNKGASIDKLSKEFNVKPQTIISNIARYVNEGKKVSLDGLAEMLSLPEERRQKVIESFKEEGTATLSNIFEKFNKEISYIDLHILRIIYLCEQV